MQKLKSILILLLSLSTLDYCYSQNREPDYGNIASIPEGVIFNDTILSVLKVNQDLYKESSKLVYYFNGNCSACISSFLIFFKDWIDSDMIIPAFFIASAPNLNIVRFNMEKANLIPEKSFQFLLLDSLDQVKNFNPFMNKVGNSIYALLIDEQNRVVDFQIPFLSESVMIKYKKAEFEYRHNKRVVANPQNGSEPSSILDIIDKKSPSLIIMNEKECSLDQLKKNIGKITNWSYFEGSSAIILYGKKANNGVLLVKTR